MIAAAVRLRSALPAAPRVAVILGSGLGRVADALEERVTVPFADIPGLPEAGVAGHAGQYHSGTLGGTPVLLQAGRYHAYEGHEIADVAAPVRILAELGVETLVLTNAAGGIHPRIVPGDLVLIDDHLNLMFRGPLTGPVVGGEARFPDMSAPYDRELQSAVRKAAARVGVELARGTYAGVLGPAYETAAEVRMLAKLGADLVGMSTVPEVIAARALGLRCVALSMVTNKATGLSADAISHEDVLRIGEEAGSRLGRVLAAAVGDLVAAPQSTATK